MIFSKKYIKIYASILLLLGFLTRFAYFGYPKSVVFDEHYYGAFAADYITGNYFFDVHPPLAKLLITLPALVVHSYPEASMFAMIDTAYPNGSYLPLRFMPSLCGSFIPLLLFLIALELGISTDAAFLVGLLAVFDNSLITESRFILIDVFIIFFGFVGLYSYLRYRKKRTSNRNSFWFLCISILFFSCALSVKWTGLSFLGVAGLIEISDLYRSREHFTLWLKHFFAFLLIPIVVYFGLFAIHMHILHKTGDGDDFMTPAFQKTLIGNIYQADPSIKPLSVWGKILETNKVSIDVRNQPQFSTHPYESRWYTWPLMLRPIYYWYSNNGPNINSRIYLFGNPAVYWPSSLSVVILLLVFIFAHKKLSKEKREVALILVLLFMANWIPFVFIARGMFLYHYLPGLCSAILILGFVFDFIPCGRIRNLALFSITGIVVILFFYFAPLTYGFSLSDTSYAAKLWLKSWE